MRTLRSPFSVFKHKNGATAPVDYLSTFATAPYKNISVQTVLKIMDIFAIPYKAAVLRLLEEDKIDIKSAKKLLQIDIAEITKQIELTGKAARWQVVSSNFIRFGSLSELMYDVEQLEAARDERLESDKKRLDEIMKGLKKQ